MPKFRALRGECGADNSTIQAVLKKFERTGSVTDIARPVHNSCARSTLIIAAVSKSVAEDLTISRR